MFQYANLNELDPLYGFFRKITRKIKQLDKKNAINKYWCL